jgi:hypothetical protein
MKSKMLSNLKLIIIVLFSSIIPAKVYGLTPDKVFDMVKDSVVVVKTLDTQGKVRVLGSGVLLPSGRIATNCHVIKGGFSYQVSQGQQIAEASLYAEDDDKDICLLDAKDFHGKPAQLGAATTLKVGVKVYAIGAPEGLELSLSDGIVSQLRGGPPPLIQTTAAISHGSSGGGLFDDEGRLVGLTTLYVKGGQNLNFAMPVEWINQIKPGRKQLTDSKGKIEWTKRAVALEASKNWQDLLDWCQKWSKYEPDNYSVWFLLGNAYAHLEHYNQAADAYRHALRINPENAEIGNNLGFIYIFLMRYNDAVDICLRVLRINPEKESTWFLLGNAYAHLEEYKKAADAYRHALRINPENAEVLRGLGEAYIFSGNQSAALDVVKILRRLDPKGADELSNRMMPR